MDSFGGGWHTRQYSRGAGHWNNGFYRLFRELSFSLLGLLLVLPFFSTLFLIVRGDRQHQLVFHVAAWSLAFGVGLLLALSSYPNLFWVLWGVWLYVGLAASALILEVVMLAARRRPDHG